MFVFATFALAVFASAVAQTPPAGGPPPAQAQAPQQYQPLSPIQQPLETGPCLDSLRAVPKAIVPPASRSGQIVRIDLVLSTATMMPAEIIGFLYTTQGGATWLGQRTADFQSAADATAINRVLGATHISGYNVVSFPATSRYGVPTKHTELFRVSVPSDALRPLEIAIAPCVIWPSGRPLPDPTM